MMISLTLELGCQTKPLRPPPVFPLSRNCYKMIHVGRLKFVRREITKAALNVLHLKYAKFFVAF